MTTTHRAGLGCIASALLAALTVACGAAEGSDTSRIAERSAGPDPVDACTVVPAGAFASIVGGEAKTMGDVSTMGDGWYSNCWFTGEGGLFGEGRLYLMLNAMFEPSKTSRQLGEFIAAQTAKSDDDSITPPEPAEGFSEPAVQFFHNELGMHVVMVQHGAYWVQAFAPDLDNATQAMRIVLEHAP